MKDNNDQIRESLDENLKQAVKDLTSPFQEQLTLGLNSTLEKIKDASETATIRMSFTKFIGWFIGLVAIILTVMLVVFNFKLDNVIKEQELIKTYFIELHNSLENK